MSLENITTFGKNNLIENNTTIIIEKVQKYQNL